MKKLLFIMLLPSIVCSAEWVEEQNDDKLASKYTIYLEETNFRVNNLILLNNILIELKAIRCQQDPESCEEEEKENGVQ